MIRLMIANTADLKARDVINRKIVGNAWNMTHQNHCWVTMIHSTKSDYKRKKCNKNNSHRKKNPVKLCTNLIAKLLMTAYKPNIIKFKMDEDPLQLRIYFLTFVESPEMILYQYKETCEVILDYPKIGGENIKDFF